jgi:carbamoyltransferase
MNLLGISHLHSANPAAALMIDGELIAFAEEERFIRQRYAHSFFPQSAINFCLKEASITEQDIDLVSVGFERADQTLANRIESNNFSTFPSARIDEDGSLKNDEEAFLYYCKFGRSEISNDYLLQKYIGKNLGISADKILWYSHHLSHAASSCVPSSFDSCNFMSLDGDGGAFSGLLGFYNGKSFEIYDSLGLHESLGAYYSAVTTTLGFHRHGGEGKTMGLASYGSVDKSCFPLFSTINKVGNTNVDALRYNKWAVDAGFLPDEEKQNILDSKWTNVAATCQHYFEEIVIGYARKLYEKTGNKNFAVAGGSFLNCTANGKLLEQDFVDNLFVQPASHDAGSALGAAILACKDVYGEFPNVNFPTAYWGSSFNTSEIFSELLSDSTITYEMIDPASRIAELLQENKVIGYMAGKAEVGPRALCHRSILANPTIKENLDRVNKIKGREFWRPLAPTMPEERLHDIVDIKHSSPFMLIAAQVKEEWRQKIPAVVHVDGSCRPQSVDAKQNSVIHKALLNFEKLSGAPVFLNTSFNLDGEPMVDSPADALCTFLKSELDVLIIENFLIKRR